MKARICIIGNGQFANKVHYQSLTSLDNVEIVGICAFNEERLKQTAKTYSLENSKLYVAKLKDDYQKMLLELRPDGVYAIGPPDIMYPVWIWCLQQGFNLFIEKPMGVTMHQSRLLATLATENNCITQVGHQRRSAPLMKLLKEKCEEHGKVVHATVEFFKAEANQTLIPIDRMLDDFVHVVDTARWICGGEVIKIDSTCKRVGTSDINWIGAMLHFDNGATAFTIGNWASGKRLFRAQLHTPGAYAEIDPENQASLAIGNPVQTTTYTANAVAKSDSLAVIGGFQNKSIEFITSILSHQDITSSPFSDTIKTMEICQQILAREATARHSI